MPMMIRRRRYARRRHFSLLSLRCYVVISIRCPRFSFDDVTLSRRLMFDVSLSLSRFAFRF